MTTGGQCDDVAGEHSGDSRDAHSSRRVRVENLDELNSELAAEPEVAGNSAPPSGPARPDESDAPSGGALFDQVRRLQPSAKLHLALKAEQTTRAVLLRDNDTRILLALCKNPHITVDEILQIARNARVPSTTLEYIIRNPQWIGREEIRYAVVVNPKTPIPMTLRLLPRLSRKNLRSIAKSQAVRLRIKTAALKLVIASPE